MKKILISIFVIMLTFVLFVPNADARQRKTVEINQELSAKLNKYNNELTNLKLQYVKNQNAIILMFYNTYDLYDETVANNKNTNIDLIIKHSNNINYDIEHHLSWYDTDAQKRYCATVSKNDYKELSLLYKNEVHELGWLLSIKCFLFCYFPFFAKKIYKQ